MLLSYYSLAEADDKIEEVNKNDINNQAMQETIQTATSSTGMPKIDSRYAVVLDRKSKAILCGKKEETRTKMASTTNIVTVKEILLNLLDIKAIQRLKVNL